MQKTMTNYVNMYLKENVPVIIATNGSTRLGEIPYMTKSNWDMIISERNAKKKISGEKKETTPRGQVPRGEENGGPRGTQKKQDPFLLVAKGEKKRKLHEEDQQKAKQQVEKVLSKSNYIKQRENIKDFIHQTLETFQSEIWYASFENDFGYPKGKDYVNLSFRGHKDKFKTKLGLRGDDIVFNSLGK